MAYVQRVIQAPYPAVRPRTERLPSVAPLRLHHDRVGQHRQNIHRHIVRTV